VSAIASYPSSAARRTSVSGDDPPRRNEKFERTASSTYASLFGARESGGFSGGAAIGMRLPAS